MHNTEHEPHPGRPDHENQRVPDDAQRNLGNVQRESVGIRVEPAAEPDQGRGEAHEEGWAEWGEVDEPQRREPEGLVG